MRTLAATAGKADTGAGAFLPPVFGPLGRAQILARKGTVTCLAGPAGAMKTALALYLVLKAGVPTWYLSADAEDFEMVERSAAAISGDAVETVRSNPGAYSELLTKHTAHISFCFEDSPTYEDIDLELAAYAETHYPFVPECIVIDNLMNVVGENENEWASMRDSARFLHRLARMTGAAVLVLHHMSDDRRDTTTPAPRSSLQGKVSQLFKAIWSLALDGDQLKIAPVKNRWGRADTSGHTYATIWVDPERMRFFNSRADKNLGIPA